jgi:hypothetical protein
MRLHFGEKPLPNANRAIFVEGGVIAERTQEKLQRL